MEKDTTKMDVKSLNEINSKLNEIIVLIEPYKGEPKRLAVGSILNAQKRINEIYQESFDVEELKTDNNG